MQLQLPPLIYELSHAGQHAFAAGYGIALDNHPFDMALPKLFKDALGFIKNHAMKQQPYFILRINSPGGAVDASLKPILDLLFAPDCPPFFTVCEGIAASCGFVLYCAGWSAPSGLGGSVSPRAQLMCHRVQLCLPSKQWDGADLEKLNAGSRHTQAELAYEINKIWLDNSVHIPLSMVPFTLKNNQVKYNPKGMMRQAMWPEDFPDYIAMFNNDEIALFNSIIPTPHAWREKGVPQRLSDGTYSWKPSERLPKSSQERDVAAYVQSNIPTATVGYVDSGRSMFRDYSAWIITRSYETEASTSNDADDELAHIYRPSSVKMHLCEYHNNDRYPYLSFVQRLLRAAREAGTEEIWLDATEAQRLGLSYEPSLMHLTVEQTACTVMPSNISKNTQEQIKAKMDKTSNPSCGCNDIRTA